MKKISSNNLLIILLIVFLIALINLDKILPFPPAERLLVDITNLLPTWKLNPEEPQRITQGPLGGRKTIHTAQSLISSTEGGISQEFYQFTSCNDSENYYSRRTEGLTNQLDTDEWNLLQDISFKSNIANKFEFLCFESMFSYPMVGCSYIAQYGHYVVMFQGSWNVDSAMSHTMFFVFFLALENKMSSWYRFCIF